jgi:hypothetical protein
MPDIHVNTDGTVTVLSADPLKLAGGSTDSDAPVNGVIGDLEI